MKAIVADSEGCWRLVYAGVLKTAFPGIDIEEAASERELEERVRKDYFSVVMCDDIQFDGLNVLRRLREVGNQRRSYIVFCLVGQESYRPADNCFNFKHGEIYLTKKDLSQDFDDLAARLSPYFH
ncbi:hypothetical protein COV20_01165 [Candidatus Woesearchaeota archaeon CG10_big_fil_rev_8_21_14_0_10_45_16]|nr:MAG: hypothetical protein COV20_01165 [Candidatus Woesearchaeota archaeon CG10_big_fil_rev_8_21_14_0_10_45_16]